MKKRTNEISYWQMPASFRWYRHAVVQVCSQHTLLTSLPPRLVPRKTGLRVGVAVNTHLPNKIVLLRCCFLFRKHKSYRASFARQSTQGALLLNWITGVFWVLKCDLEICTLSTYSRAQLEPSVLGNRRYKYAGCDMQTQSKRLSQTTYTGLFVPHKIRPY